MFDPSTRCPTIRFCFFSHTVIYYYHWVQSVILFIVFFLFLFFFNEQPGCVRNAGQPSRQHTCTITGAWAHLLKTEKLKGNVFLSVKGHMSFSGRADGGDGVINPLKVWPPFGRVMCKNAAFLRFIIIYLLLVQPMPYPQLHLAELLDDKSIDSLWNHLSKPHKVQCTLGMRWGFCRLATRRYHLNDGAHIIYPWMERWRLTDGTSVVTSDSSRSLFQRARATAKQALPLVTHKSSRPASSTFCLCRDLLWNRPHEQSRPPSFEHCTSTVHASSVQHSKLTSLWI